MGPLGGFWPKLGRKRVTGWKQRSCVPPGRVKTNKQTNQSVYPSAKSADNFFFVFCLNDWKYHLWTPLGPTRSGLAGFWSHFWQKKKKKSRLILCWDQMAIHFGSWRPLLLELGPTFVNKSLLIFCQAHLLCYRIFFWINPFWLGWKCLLPKNLNFKFWQLYHDLALRFTHYRHHWRMLYLVKNKKIKNVVVVEGYKKWFCVFHIFATRAMNN
jgi:hypothetical protein